MSEVTCSRLRSQLRLNDIVGITDKIPQAFWKCDTRPGPPSHSYFECRPLYNMFTFHQGRIVELLLLSLTNELFSTQILLTMEKFYSHPFRWHDFANLQLHSFNWKENKSCFFHCYSSHPFQLRQPQTYFHTWKFPLWCDLIFQYFILPDKWLDFRR